MQEVVGVEVEFFDLVISTREYHRYVEPMRITRFIVNGTSCSPGAMTEIRYHEPRPAYFSDDLIINLTEEISFPVYPQGLVASREYGWFDSVVVQSVRYLVEPHCDKTLIVLALGLALFHRCKSTRRDSAVKSEVKSYSACAVSEVVVFFCDEVSITQTIREVRELLKLRGLRVCKCELVIPQISSGLVWTSDVNRVSDFRRAAYQKTHEVFEPILQWQRPG